MDEKLKNEFINTFWRLMKTRSRLLANRDPSWGELMRLKKLEADGNVNGLFERLHISKPAVTYMLNSLEKGGYITRGIDTSDRRRIVITLTGKGKQIVKTHRESYEILINEALAKFGERNCKDLVRLFNRFADIIDELKEERKNA